MIKKYEKYKESGIEWLGEIPEHWKVLNFRYIIDVLTDFTSNGSFADLAKNVTYLESGYSRLVRLTDLRENLNNNGIFVSEETHKYLSKSTLYGDEVLLANVGAYSGLACKVPHLDCPATLGPNMFLLKFKKELNNDFAFLSLNSEYLSSQLKNKAISSAQPKLNKEDVRTCFFVLPPVSEQTQIANFLDHQTAIIDDLIGQKEKLIALLKEKRQAIINEAVTKGLNPNANMKDSGIEWLGEVPEEWKVLNFRYVINILTDFTANGSFADLAKNVTYLESGYSRLVRLTDLRDNLNNVGIYVSEQTHNYLSKSALYGDEVLLANVGAYAGLACKVPTLNGPATLGPNMLLLKFKEELNNDYAFLSLNSEYLSSQLKNKAVSSAQPKLNKEDVRSCFFILPPIEEQIEIINHLNVVNNNCFEIIDAANIQISKLKEYRQSLISEAVTGKIDVRDWKPAN